MGPANTTDPIADRVAALALQRGIRLVLQFGSTVSGRTHAASDLDLAVLFDRPPASLLAQGEVAADFQAILPEREVDLVVLNHADPLLLHQVVTGARLLYGAPRTMAELRLYAFKRYQDHRRFFAMERAYVRRKLGTEP